MTAIIDVLTFASLPHSHVFEGTGMGDFFKKTLIQGQSFRRMPRQVLIFHSMALCCLEKWPLEIGTGFSSPASENNLMALALALKIIWSICSMTTS